MPKLILWITAFIVTGCAADSGQPSAAEGAPLRIAEFEISEGTQMSLDVSPDGTQIVFDLLGDLYLMPVDGGAAVSLTEGSAWDKEPKFSRDGEFVYFISDRIGHKNIWRINLEHRQINQISEFCHSISGSINWDFGGTRLIFGLSENTLDSRLFEYTPIDRSLLPIDSRQGAVDQCGGRVDPFVRSRVFSGVESASGDILFSEAKWWSATEEERGVNIYRFSRSASGIELVTDALAEYDEYKPQISPSGTRLAYFRQYPDASTELRVVNVSTGEVLLAAALDTPGDAYFVQSSESRPNYAFLPDESAVVFWHGGKIFRASIVDGSIREIPFSVRVVREMAHRVGPRSTHFRIQDHAPTIRWPGPFSDGSRLLFSAVGYVWIQDLDSGQTRKITREDEFAFSPIISPDESQVAFVTIDNAEGEFGPANVIVVNIEDGQRRTLLSAPYPINSVPFHSLSWSSDNKRIAFLSSSETGQLSVGWVSAETGESDIVVEGMRQSIVSVFPNAFFVAFDGVRDAITFGFPEMARGRAILPITLTEFSLVSVDLQTRAVERIAGGGETIRSLIPSPDRTRLLLTLHNGSVWIVSNDETISDAEALLGRPEVHQLDAEGAHFLRWLDDHQVIFSLGQFVSIFDLRTNQTTTHRIEVPAESPPGQGVVALRGARLITMQNPDDPSAVVENGTIVFANGRLLDVGRSDTVPIPAEAVVINAEGRTIIPGLIDSHYHNLRGGVSALALPSDQMSRENSLTYGITTAWDPGGLPGDTAMAAADYFRGGRIIGPRWMVAGGAIGRTEGLIIDDYLDMQSQVSRRNRLGVRLMKEYELPTREHHRWLASAAREFGLGIVSHIESYDQMMTEVLDGYTGGDHTNIIFYDDAIQILARSDYIWTPNLFLTQGNIGRVSGSITPFDASFTNEERDFLSVLEETYPDELDKFQRVSGRPIGLTSAWSARYRDRRISRMASAVARAHAAGVRIAVSGHERPGLYLHMEMWHLSRGGIPEADILLAATLTNAEKLGIEQDTGSLEVGKLADFLILSDDPLDSIINTLSIEYTVQGGVIYDPQSSLDVAPEELGRALH